MARLGTVNIPVIELQFNYAMLVIVRVRDWQMRCAQNYISSLSLFLLLPCAKFLRWVFFFMACGTYYQKTLAVCLTIWLVPAGWLTPVFVRPSGVSSRVARVSERTTTRRRHPRRAGGAAVCAGSAVPCTACRPISCLAPWAPACLSTGQVLQCNALNEWHTRGGCFVCESVKRLNDG